MSTRPKRSLAPAIAAVAPEKVSRSAMMAIASAPAASASCRTSSASGERSTSASFPPSCAMRIATVRPIPCAAPVMTATLPAKRPVKIIAHAARSDVIDVHDVVDVVILQNYFLPCDQRLRASGVEGVERRAEIGIHTLVAVAERHPIEPQLADTVLLLEDLHVTDVVRGPRLGQAGGTRPLGADPEDPILEAALVAVPDQ